MGIHSPERIREDSPKSPESQTHSSASDLMRLGDQYRQSAILHFAVAERLFDITQQPVTAAETAQRLGALEKKTRILLDALVAMELLERDSDHYVNSPLVDRCLVSTSAEFIGPVLDHQRLQWASWERLGEVLRSEESLPFQQEIRLDVDRDAREAFNKAMVRLSQLLIESLVELPVFETAGTVIDLAGGHGTYIARIAKNHPHLRGEIWDQPSTEEAAAKTLSAWGVDSRIHFCRKDITLPENYSGVTADVVMLNDCLHYFTAETVESLIRCAAGIVPPGGVLLILTMRLEEDRVRPPLSADFSLHMMLNTAHGELHPTPWIANVMTSQGLEVREKEVGRYSLLIGKR
jgi:uncharacterized protein YqcC (DUF446 family)